MFLVVPQLLVATVLLLSGIAKVREPQATSDAFTALRLPPALVRLRAPRWLPWLEIVLGGALVVIEGWAQQLAALGSLGLFGAYVVVLGNALTFDEPVRCGCFGRLGDHAITRRTLIRNIVLVGTAALALWGSLAGVSTLALVRTSPTDLGWVAAAALAAAVAVLVLGRGTTPTPEGTLTDPASLALRDPAGGALVRLGTLTDTVLIFLEPGCAPCDRVAAALPALASTAPRTVRVVVSEGAPPTADLNPLVDPAGNVGAALVGLERPAAIVLDPSGGISAISHDESGIVALLRPPAASGLTDEPPLAVPDAREQPGNAEEYLRTAIPRAVLIDSDRSPVLLSELASAQPVLVVSITCLCGSSKRVVDRLADWAERLPVVRVVIAPTFAPEKLPQQPGLAERAFHDHGGVAHVALGMTGTPSAVLLGADGQLAGGPVHGEEIERFVTDIESELTAAGLLPTP
ncbi:MAG: TlpA family protein disulfide reductase [Propioniciclava sp.]